MNQKSFIFLSFLVISFVTTIGIVSAQKNQSSIKLSQNELGASINREDRIINSKKIHQSHNNTYQKIRAKNSLSKSFQQQQTTVNISSSDLNQPNLLYISSSQQETQLTVEILLNGQLIESFTDNYNMLDLSPYLTPGKQTVLILGNYTPLGASIKVEFKGKTTHVSQEMKGSGELQQQLIFHVK